MKVLEVGPEYKRAVRCPSCKSLLEYTPNDVSVYEVHHPDTISCPLCARAIPVEIPKNWWPFVYTDEWY